MKCTTTVNGQTKEIMYGNTGVPDGKGGTVWRSCTVNGRTITFGGTEKPDADAIAKGEIPQSAEIDPETGEVVGTYANGRSIVTDNAGRYKKIMLGGKQSTEILYGPSGEFRGYRQTNGVELLQGKQVEGSDKDYEWTIRRPGQPDQSIKGQLSKGDKGALQISQGDKSLTVFASGATIEKAGNQYSRVVDAKSHVFVAKPGSPGTWIVDGKEVKGEPKLSDDGDITVG